MISNYKSILTFFAHPDDETLAAGATINKISNKGCRVHVAIPATGVGARKNILSKKTIDKKLKNLKIDSLKALSKIGVKKSDVYFGKFSDNEMDKYPLLKLIHWAEDIIEKVKPDAIITHHQYCTNIDHRYCHEAIVVATRPSINCHIPIFCAEVPDSAYLKPIRWEPNYFVKVTEKDVDAKILAMETYKDESRSDPHPRSPEVLKSLAKVRGSAGGFFFAESFMIQKIFQD